MTRPAHAGVIAALTLVLAAGGVITAAGQSRDADTRPATGTARVAGVVTDGSTRGTPVRRALVRLSTGGLAMSTVTDDEGRFNIGRLPAGSYMVTVNKSGWVTSYYGSRQPGRAPGTPIVLADDEQRLDLVVPLTRGAVIGGRIVDEFGLPVAGLRPVLMMPVDRGGRRALTSMGTAGMGTTDDRGEFRAFGLAPGTYYVGVTPRNSSAARLTLGAEVDWARARAAGTSGRQGAAPPPGPSVGFAPVYYPGTVDVNAATPITVGPGDERADLVITLQYVPMAAISGTFIRADGQPMGRSVLNLISSEAVDSPLQGNTMRATTRADGTFEFPEVPPGRYELWARASRAPATGPNPPSPTQDMDLWASSEVVASGRDISGIVLTLRPGMDVRGALRVDPLAGPAEMSAFGVTLRTPPEPGQGARSLNLRIRPLEADGRFTLSGVPPGRYLLTGQGPSGWRTKSVLVDGVEHFDELIAIVEDRAPASVVVTMTNQRSELTGHLMDATGAPAPGFYVLAFTTDRAAWRPNSTRIQSTRPNGYGEYSFNGIPPGEYFVVALTDLPEVDWATAEVLDQFVPLALRVTVAEGVITTQDIRIAR